jgi:hypothetical protein
MLPTRCVSHVARIVAWCCGVGVCLLVALPQQLPDLYHDESHGDAPFLAEPSWRPLLNGTSLAGWHAQDGKPLGWFTSKSVGWRRVFAPTRLEAAPAPGDRIVNSKTGRTANLVTDEKFGDLELYLEFILAKGSNSGIFLHGLYETQIFDSFAYSGALMVGDCGGIYRRADGGGGSPPQRNASRPPGEWQSFHIWFRAPRFDAAGKKIENARYLRVLLNETLVQEGVELQGPTQAHMDLAEAATNPLMLQGDHGPVAFRNIYVRPLRAP